MLVDYGDVLVHIFSPEQRAFYQLDELWNQAVPVLSIQ
jgi:ribosome-associated protein